MRVFAPIDHCFHGGCVYHDSSNSGRRPYFTFALVRSLGPSPSAIRSRSLGSASGIYDAPQSLGYYVTGFRHDHGHSSIFPALGKHVQNAQSD
jgi:hypothetical protein